MTDQERLQEVMKERDRLRKEIEQLSTDLNEKRSDISEVLMRIIDGLEWDASWIESRFILKKFKTPNGDIINICYDTLTTYLETQINDGEWEYGTEQYTDNGVWDDELAKEQEHLRSKHPNDWRG